jgi:hypothetical protein
MAARAATAAALLVRAGAARAVAGLLLAAPAGEKVVNDEYLKTQAEATVAEAWSLLGRVLRPQLGDMEHAVLWAMLEQVWAAGYRRGGEDEKKSASR